MHVKDNKSPVLSVVVPVYKVELYLQDCIDSILEQSFPDFELILVDDGSPDNCPMICDQAGENDSRIVVIHKSNGGLSDARNAGISIARGKYITFVDSDDLISNNAFELLISQIESYNTDIVISERYFSFSGKISPTKSISNKAEKCTSEEALDRVFCLNTRWEAWGTLYKRELFIKETFPVGKLYEDIALIPKIIYKSKSILFSDAIIYYYRIRENSIMRSFTSDDLANNCNEIIRMIKESNFQDYRKNRIVAGVLLELASRMDSVRSDLESGASFYQKAEHIIQDNQRAIFCAPNIEIKKKIYVLCYGHGLGWLITKAHNIKLLLTK